MDENLLAIFDFAIREEEGAKLLYAKAASLTDDLLANQLLSELSGIEEEHGERLRHFRDSQLPNPGALIAGPAIRWTDYQVEGAPLESSSLENLIAFAIQAEERSHKLYSTLASRFTIPEAAQLLRELATEERQHKNHLERLYATAPRA